MIWHLLSLAENYSC